MVEQHAHLANGGIGDEIPPAHREQAIEMMEFTGDARGNMGFGFKSGTAERGS